MLFDKRNQNNLKKTENFGYKNAVLQAAVVNNINLAEKRRYTAQIKQSYMNSMVNITYVQTEFADSITNLEYSQIELRFGNELQLLRSLSGLVLSI